MNHAASSYHGYRFPPEIISHAVWLYHRFCLSFRDAEDLLAQRGVTVTYETIRQWCRTFGPADARTLRDAGGRWATRGTWTNCSSISKGGSSISGGRSTRTAT